MSRTDESSKSLSCELCPPDPDRMEPCPPWSEVEYARHLQLVHACELCGMLCETESTRTIHLWRIHGKEYRFDKWFKVVGDEAIPQFGRFVDVDEWQNPLETLGGLPTDPEGLCRWLYPMCARMLEFKHPEAALFVPPVDLGTQALFVEAHFRAILTLFSTARFKRLKGSEARALLMAKVIVMPNCSPGYAEQKLRGVGLETHDKRK
jgi:hypothetical protein